MKLSRFLIITFLSVLLFACNSDDDGDTTETVTPTITADVDAIIALPDGSDITNLVDFGQPAGVPTNEYTVEVGVGDALRLTQPNGLPSDVTFWYSRVDFFEEDPQNPGSFIPINEFDVRGVYLEYNLPEEGTPEWTEDPNFPGSGFGIHQFFELESIDALDDELLEYKYDIRVLVEQNGTFFGYYTIDPKLKIKSRN